MDNDTKKILLLIARALQSSALAQLANVGVYGGDGVALQANSLAQAASANRFNVWREDINKEIAISAALFAKIENEEKQREAAEKYMDEIYRKALTQIPPRSTTPAAEKYMDEIHRKGDEAVEKRKEEIRRKVGNEENNNA